MLRLTLAASLQNAMSCRREVYWHALKLALIKSWKVLTSFIVASQKLPSIKQSNAKDYSIRPMATEHKQSDLNTMDTIIHPQQFLLCDSIILKSSQ